VGISWTTRLLQGRVSNYDLPAAINHDVFCRVVEKKLDRRIKDTIKDIQKTMGVQLFVMAGYRTPNGKLVKVKYVLLRFWGLLLNYDASSIGSNQNHTKAKSLRNTKAGKEGPMKYLTNI
jgi:hypothetical protein